MGKLIWITVLLTGFLAGMPIRPAYAIVPPITSIDQAEHPLNEEAPPPPSSKVVIQITLDQLILGIGVLLFLVVIYNFSVRPILAMVLIAATALLGCLFIKMISRF